jgi:hypothetical protein
MIKFFLQSLLCYGVARVAGKGLALGSVADFEAQNCQYITKVDASYNTQLTNSTAIDPSPCYAQTFYAFLYFLNACIV